MFNVVFCIADSFFNYINVSFDGLNTSVGEERADLSTIDYSLLCSFCSMFHQVSVLRKGCVILFWHTLCIRILNLYIEDHIVDLNYL